MNSEALCVPFVITILPAALGPEALYLRLKSWPFDWESFTPHSAVKLHVSASAKIPIVPVEKVTARN